MQWFYYCLKIQAGLHQPWFYTQLLKDAITMKERNSSYLEALVHYLALGSAASIAIHILGDNDQISDNSHPPTWYKASFLQKTKLTDREHFDLMLILSPEAESSVPWQVHRNMSPAFQFNIKHFCLKNLV